MNKNTGIIIGVIILIVIAISVYASSVAVKNDAMMKDNTEDTVMTKTDDKMMEDDNSMEEGNDAMMENDETSMMDNGDTMMKAGSYEVYTPEKVALASDTHDVVLFFRASWCPTCRAVDTNINANISKIPSSLAILDVNYDDSTALKQKYGVTYQHTFVQVDKDGTLIKKWSGSPTLTALVAEVQ